MLSQIAASYKRVETSLQRLTDSIAAYNPSVAAADELLAADDAVNDDLAQLIAHQQNHIRIEELRRTTNANDAILKAQFRQLVDLRKELASMRSYEAAPPSSDVSVHDLLAYAKFISKTTVPPTLRKEELALRPAKVDLDRREGQLGNGTSTSPQPIDGLNGQSQTQDQTQSTTFTNVAVNAMSDTEKAWLDPLSNLPFEPWPSLDIIQNGALADIQRMIDRGEDPAKVLSPEEQAKEIERKRIQEEQERIEEEERERRRMSMFDVGAAHRRSNAQDDDFDPDA